MHTREGHVKAMNALGVTWMAVLKDNQPGLYAAADGQNRPETGILVYAGKGEPA